MVTTLYLIRHGETEGSETKRYKGSIDVPLSKKGIKQIKRTSSFLKGYIKKQASSKYLSYLRDIHKTKGSRARGQGVSPRRVARGDKGSRETQRLAAVYTSNLSRAVKSAEIIARPYKLKPIQMKELRERSFGIWEGMSFTEIKERYPEEFSAWAGNPLKYSPIEGESTVEVEKRVMKAVNRILKKHKGDEIAIVSHGGVSRIILCRLLGIPLENIFRIEQDYAAVNIIEFWDKYPVVKLINGAVNV
ncbi:MAG: histidine phosphatase family protein [Thermodesulfovibrionales bacterium]|nr:histidine phosphatase family protein [Thermodesulfovibrionales bacterium]MDP3111821.1 histidine phosphatase family protein [Thermodesulfovibrionales bacterium]